MTDFKPGERVVATLGESRLVGEIDRVGTASAGLKWVYLWVDGFDREGLDPTFVTSAGGWQLTLAPPAVPTLRNAVVVDRNGLTYVLYRGDWRSAHGHTHSEKAIADILANGGRVVFGGEPDADQ
jgi:hypothetical protein